MSLSAEQERSLVSIVQSNSPAKSLALKILHEEYRPFLTRQARFYSQGDPCSRADLYQEGFLGLYAAVQNFDLNSQNRLSTFAIPRIRQRMQYWLKKENRYFSSHKSFEAISEDADENFSDEGSIDESQNDLLQSVKKLPAIQSRAIFMYFYEDYLPSEIAERLKISRPRVTKLMSSGLKNLKKEVLLTEQ